MPRAKALRVHAQLCAKSGAPFRFFSTRDPLNELMSALLSHPTKNTDSHRAYQELRSTFTGRDAVLREVSYRCDGGPCSDLRFLGSY